MIVFRENKSSGWGYFTHCAALSVLIALAVCHAPLLHDYTVVYRGSLDGSVLACVVTAILHLFLWVSISLNMKSIYSSGIDNILHITGFNMAGVNRQTKMDISIEGYYWKGSG